jgi:hypothetical protein
VVITLGKEAEPKGKAKRELLTEEEVEAHYKVHGRGRDGVHEQRAGQDSACFEGALGLRCHASTARSSCLRC